VSLQHEPAGFPDAELRKERNVLRSAAISTQPFQKQTYRRIAKFVFGQFNRREARTKATKPGIVVETHQREILRAAHTNFVRCAHQSDCDQVVRNQDCVRPVRQES
jgi:hypothetical protein